MAMDPLVKQLAELQRRRALLRARLATVALDLSECEAHLKKVAAQLTDDQTAPAPEETPS